MIRQEIEQHFRSLLDLKQIQRFNKQDLNLDNPKILTNLTIPTEKIIILEHPKFSEVLITGITRKTLEEYW